MAAKSDYTSQTALAFSNPSCLSQMFHLLCMFENGSDIYANHIQLKLLTAHIERCNISLKAAGSAVDPSVTDPVRAGRHLSVYIQFRLYYQFI